MSRWNVAQKAERESWEREETKHMLKGLYYKYGKLISDFEKEAGVKKDWKLLDLGSGPTCAVRIFKRGRKYAIDPLMDFYEKKFEMPKDIVLKKGAGEDVASPSGFFDVVLCVNVINHVKDPEKVLKEIKRLLRKGGYLLITVEVYPEFIASKKRFAEAHVPFLREVYHPFIYSEQMIKEQVSKYFKIKRTRRIPLGMPGLEMPAKSSESFLRRALRRNVRMLRPLCYRLFWSFIGWINDKVLKNEYYNTEFAVVSQKE